MDALTYLTHTRRLRAWVLWFVLLLPLAQLAAVWHAHAHDRALSRADHCELCVIATAVTSGGAVSEIAALPVFAQPDFFAPLAGSPLISAAVFTAYLSRAPPTASH